MPFDKPYLMPQFIVARPSRRRPENAWQQIETELRSRQKRQNQQETQPLANRSPRSLAVCAINIKSQTANLPYLRKVANIGSNNLQSRPQTLGTHSADKSHFLFRLALITRRHRCFEVF